MTTGERVLKHKNLLPVTPTERQVVFCQITCRSKANKGENKLHEIVL